MSIIRNCLVSLSLLFFVNANANRATDDLVAIFKHINTIQGTFIQTIKGQGNTTIDTSTGEFILQRPNQFRWQVLSPLKQLTVANGKKVWFYQPALEQVTISAMSKQIGQTPLAILSGSTQILSKNYTITQLKKTHTFILVPKNTANEFKRIELTVVNQKLKQMIFFDNLGQKTILQFANIVLNENINRNNFQFTPPKGVDVINN